MNVNLTYVMLRMINFKRISCPQSVSTSRFVRLNPMTRYASFRSGIPLAKSALKQLLPVITRELMVSLSPTISLTETPSTQFTLGWVKSKSTHKTTSHAFWLEIRQISSRSEQFRLKRDRKWPITTVYDSLRPQPRSARMSIRLSSSWLVKLNPM